MSGPRHTGSWRRQALIAATALVTSLCLASQAGGVARLGDRPPRVIGPAILSIRLNRASLPSRGGAVKVTMRTADADACRLVATGEQTLAESVPHRWTNCSRGIARATIRIGANAFSTTVAAHFRDFARHGTQVMWVPFTILVHAGRTGEPDPEGVAEYSESANWSGYVVPSTASVVDSTSGAWTVPVLNCTDTPNAAVAEWVGIGGVDWPGGGSSGALLQTGTEDRCVGGQQHDDAWWELYPSNPNESIAFSNLAVSPGDEVVATVYETAGGRWSTKIDDVTKRIAGIMLTGSGYGTSLDGAKSGGFSKEGSTALLGYTGGFSAEWIVEDSGSSTTQLTPFADFGTITFSNLATSLANWSLTSSEGVELVQNGVILSTPESPSGNGFTVHYTGP